MRPRISIRGSVRPSVGPSVGRSVGPSVTLSLKHSKYWNLTAKLTFWCTKTPLNIYKQAKNDEKNQGQLARCVLKLEDASLANWPCFWDIWTHSICSNILIQFAIRRKFPFRKDAMLKGWQFFFKAIGNVVPLPELKTKSSFSLPIFSQAAMPISIAQPFVRHCQMKL